jgi:hypothetical protein
MGYASSSLTRSGRERKSYCQGFISGIEEGIGLLETQGSLQTKASFCVPPETTSKELSDVFTGFASRRGADLDRPAAWLVMEALKHRFPC